MHTLAVATRVLVFGLVGLVVLAQQQGPSQSLSLQLALVTARIEAYSGDSLSKSGTGFFCVSKDKSKLFFVTNRHLARDEKKTYYADRFVLSLHTDASDLTRSENYEIQLYGDREKQEPLWKEIDPEIDIIAIELPKAEIQQRYAVKTFSSENFMAEDATLRLGDPLIIIGYPRGFRDKVLNLPVARQGSVGSVYPLHFEGKPYFLVDAVLHPGTSGSPVIAVSGPVRFEGGSIVFGKRGKVRLVGINSGFVGDLQLNAVWFSSLISRLVD